MRDDSRNRMFPVGLYGLLLFALVGVTVPALVAPIESAARSVVSLPLRAYAILLDENPVLASADRPGEPGEDEARGRWRMEREAVLESHASAVLRGARGPVGFEPRLCRVIGRRGATASSLPDELVLDCSSAALGDRAALVTCGTDLVGFLDATTRPDEPAIVRLLHYQGRSRRSRAAGLFVSAPQSPARVPAQVVCQEVHGVGTLRFLVEPAAAVDTWPLRCTLLDNPYLASRLRTGGVPVTTVRSPLDEQLPAGLGIGRLMIRGYPELDIPIGFFVAPARDARAISAVTVWTRRVATKSESAPESGRFVAVRLTRFPAPRPVRRRWMVTSAAQTRLPDGAALIDRGRLLGVLSGPWSGQSLVLPFGNSTKRWAFLLRTKDGDVHEFAGRVVGDRSGRRRRIEIDIVAGREVADGVGGGTDESGGGGSVVGQAGELYSGVNGPHCPAGLHIGSVRPLGDDWMLQIPEFATDGSLRPEVFVGVAR